MDVNPEIFLCGPSLSVWSPVLLVDAPRPRGCEAGIGPLLADNGTMGGSGGTMGWPTGLSQPNIGLTSEQLQANQDSPPPPRISTTFLGLPEIIFKWTAHISECTFYQLSRKAKKPSVSQNLNVETVSNLKGVTAKMQMATFCLMPYLGS